MVCQVYLDEFVRGWLRYVNEDGSKVVRRLGLDDPLDRDSVTKLVRRGYFGHPERTYGIIPSQTN